MYNITVTSNDLSINILKLDCIAVTHYNHKLCFHTRKAATDTAIIDFLYLAVFRGQSWLNIHIRKDLEKIKGLKLQSLALSLSLSDL